MPRYPERLRRLRRLLDEGHELSLREIRDRLDVTVRHARRLIRQLREQGVSVQDRRDGRIKRFFLLPEHRQVPTQDLAFDEEELLALAVSAEAAKAALAETPLGDPLARGFHKLLDELAPDTFTFEIEEQPARWHFGSPVASPIAPHVFRTLQQAINDNQSVRIDYHTASTGAFSEGRKIDPLQLARYGGTWAVIAWCHQRRALRDFALAGIERIVPCDGDVEASHFSPPDGFDPDTYFQGRFRALAGDTIRTVRLLVEADRAPYFQRKTYHPSQRIEAQPDERLIVTYMVAGLNEIRAFAQSWGVGVTVLEPKELVARMAEEAEVLAERYADDEDT